MNILVFFYSWFSLLCKRIRIHKTWLWRSFIQCNTTITKQSHDITVTRVNREKLLHQVAIVAKCLDDNKRKIHLKSKFAISFNLPNVGEIFWIESKRTVSKLRERKRNFLYCVHLLHEVRRFHVEVVQRSLKNVQKSMIHVQSCRLTNINLWLFSLLPELPFAVIPKFCSL